MALKQKQPKGLTESLRDIINVAYNDNYRCLVPAHQQKMADNLNYSNQTKVWLDHKLKCYAEVRNVNKEYNLNSMLEGLDKIKKNVDVLKSALWKEYVLNNPKTTKTFDQVFVDGEVVDEKLAEEFNDYNLKLLNDEKVETNLLYEAYCNYSDHLTAINVINEYIDVHEAICGELTNDGYKRFVNNQIKNNVKCLSRNIIEELQIISKDITKTFPALLLKQEVKLNKAYKLLSKNPENEELREQYNLEMGRYNFFQANCQLANVLSDNVNCFAKRLEAANSRELHIKDKVYEMVADLGFGVGKPIKGNKNTVSVDEIFVGQIEISNLIVIAKNFVFLAPVIQEIGYQTQITTKVSLENYEQSKLIMEELSEVHKDKKQYLMENENALEKPIIDPFAEDKVLNLDEQATKEEVAKHLLFETPLGTVWFDGVSAVNIETGEKTELSELNKFIYDADKQKFYRLKTDKIIKAGTVKIVEDENNEQSLKIKTLIKDDGMGK